MAGYRIVPENRALAQRPHLLYLPLGYAALLIMSSMFLALTLEYVGAALWLFGLGWMVGKVVTFFDPYAWELLAKNLRIPRLLRV